MKKFRWLIVILILLFASSAFGATANLAAGDPDVMGYKQMYATGTGNISATLSAPAEGTSYIEIVSIRLHLSAAGAANNLTITQDAKLGAVYDVVILTQDMTTVTDLLVTYVPGELIFDSEDDLAIAWTNGSSRTYGLEIIYRLR